MSTASDRTIVISTRITPELSEAIERLRGPRTRAAWLAHILERVVAGTAEKPQVTTPPARSSSPQAKATLTDPAHPAAGSSVSERSTVQPIPKAGR